MAEMPNPSNLPNGTGASPRAYFTTRNTDPAKRWKVYAANYGYRCWPIGRSKTKTK